MFWKVVRPLLILGLIFALPGAAFAEFGDATVTINPDGTSFTFAGDEDDWGTDYLVLLCGVEEEIFVILDEPLMDYTVDLGAPIEYVDVFVIEDPEEPDYEAGYLPFDTGECPAPPEEASPWVPRYRMVALVDTDAPDWYFGTGDLRNGTCYIKMPTEEFLPSVERQLDICNYDDGGEHVYLTYQADRVAVDAWVMWNSLTGEVSYPDPLWNSDWFDPDYTTE